MGNKNKRHKNKSSSSRIGNHIRNTVEIQVGYRFLPSDYELITEYLMKKVRNQLSGPCDNIDIRDINLYEEDPQELADKSPKVQEEENWYFFTTRQRKYAKGSRPNRSAPKGYWKPTGKDKSIMDKDGTTKIGSKKSLDYYLGERQEETKTHWKMLEYKLHTDSAPPANPNLNTPHDAMKLGDWVLCKIYKKKKKSNKKEQVSRQHHSSEAVPEILEAHHHLKLSPKILKAHYSNLGELSPPSQILLTDDQADKGSLLPDAVSPWMSCGYDNNYEMTMLSPHEVQQSGFILGGGNYNNATSYDPASDLFGNHGFLEDVVHRPRKRKAADEHGRRQNDTFDLVGHSQEETELWNWRKRSNI